MNHILEDNTVEWDARVQREEQRRKRHAWRAHLGMSAGVLLGLLGLALVFALQPKQLPAVAAPRPTPTSEANSFQPRISLDVSVRAHQPEPDVLERQAQSLAVDFARIWRSGKSEQAAKTAHSYTMEYEREVGCDLRWIAGRAGPGVWKGTRSLARSLREITPYVGRAREGQAVVVTAVFCPPEGDAP